MNNINRQYGIDVLRLLSTVGVVVLHVFGAGCLSRIISTSNSLSLSLSLSLNINYCGVLLLRILCVCSVNIFGIITGYLYVDRETYHTISIVKIIYSLFLYSIVITLFIKFVHPEWIKEKQKLIEAMFPFGIRLWYITAYFFVFFMIPYLNIFIKNCPKVDFFVFLCVLTLLLSILTTVGMRDYWGLRRGYGCFWLIYCYFIGAFIKNNQINIKKNILIFCIFSSVVFLFGLNILSLAYKSKQISRIFSHWMDYTSPLIILNAICVFLLFKDLNTSNGFLQKILVICSNSALSVFIIHAQGLVLDNIIYPFLPRRVKYNSLRFFMLGFAAVILIFVYCIIVDIIRLQIEKLCKIDFVQKKISKGLDKILKY